MKILMLAINDPAGTAIAFANALNRYTNNTCRVVTLETRYIHNWESDLHIPDMTEEDLAGFEHLLKTSDVFHFHMTADENLQFGPFLPRDYIKGKKLVHHHHGHPDFRGNPEKYQQKYKTLGRNNLLVSTPDLMHLLPSANWQPNLVPEQHHLLQPLLNKMDAPVKIAHSPTRKDLKNTDDLLAAVENIRKSGTQVELDLIDDASNQECLRRKRRCHILFDHLQGYYGVSSLEGLAQGMPVISGLDEWNRERIVEFAQTDELPWVVSSVESLAEDLAELIHDAGLRHEKGVASRRFMENHWSEQKVAQKLSDFYEDAQ